MNNANEAARCRAAIQVYDTALRDMPSMPLQLQRVFHSLSCRAEAWAGHYEEELSKEGMA